MPAPLVALGSAFATALPEMAVPWQAEQAPEPRLLVLNEPLAVELGLDPQQLRTPEGLALLVGAQVPGTPVAQAYSGHQFGGFTPRLGDGRALLLGELTTPDGRVVDLHLKGSGRTPFARGGDGLAAVGPMLREHVISEAMHALGIPTTRSLAVLATGRTVRRETLLPGGLLVRTASSHLRVGSVQFAAATGDVDLLRRVVELAITRHHPSATNALGLLSAVIDAQARLVAQWMAVGFVHGVMNTDNCTLSGETIDYGPCAFLDAYDPATVFSSIDESGRYAFGNQPGIVEWNLTRLAESLLPLVHTEQEQAIALAVEALGAFRPAYIAARSMRMRAKLGLTDPVDDLAGELLALMQADRVDFTAAFRALGRAARGDSEPARSLFLDLAGIDAWCARWLALVPDGEAMDTVNPVYVPRNHLVEEALSAGTAGDLTPLERLLDAVTRPYEERAGLERFAEPSPLDPGYRTFCGT